MQDQNGSGLRRPARAVAALALAVALLAGCAASPAQDPATGETGAQATARPVKTEFTREELLEDFDAAWQIIQEDYIFMSVLEERGLDPQQYYEAARGVMEEHAETLEDLSEWLTYLFGNMERRAFSHLSVASLSTYQVYAETYTATPEESAWDAAIHDVVTAPQTVAIYDWIASNSETLPNRLSGQTSYPEATVSYDEAHKAACFYFPTFNNATVERDAGIVQDALMELYDQGKEVENIVFDITGNGGGNTAYWANNIVAPFGGTYEFREPRFIRDTPRTRWWYQNADLHPVEEYAAEYPLPDFVEEMGLDLYDWSVQHFRCGDSTLPQELLQAKRWLLVDDTVASASSVFTSFCLKTGWATVVGTPTGSYRPSGNPAMFALPNTGLIIRLDLCATPNREGQLGCIYGLNPDILCEGDETPQEAWQRAVESGAS